MSAVLAPAGAEVLELARKAGIAVGQEIDVCCLLDYSHEPMVRRITAVRVKTEYGKRWLLWYWKPQARPDGRIDCGYSGHTIDDELVAMLVARAKAVTP